MTDTRRKVELVCHSDISIEGEGNALKLKLSGHRDKRGGGYEFLTLEFELGRYAVQRLARQIATMHERDRARLARETDRIEKEIEAITQPDTGGKTP